LGLYYKTFTAVFFAVLQLDKVFVTVSHIHPILIFGGKAESQPLDLSLVRISTLVSSSLAHKYWTNEEVTDDIANTHFIMIRQK
jgi:hypothetical protein